MNILTLIPEHQSLKYALFTKTSRLPVLEDHVVLTTRSGRNSQIVVNAVMAIQRRLVSMPTKMKPELIAIRVLHGGNTFSAPVVVDDEVTRQIEEIVPWAPLHLPVIPHLIMACQAGLPNTRIGAAFETGMSAALPSCDTHHGVAEHLVREQLSRRFSFHGLFHQAAYNRARDSLTYKWGDSCPRLVSICLSERPEVAALVAGKPLAMSGGATPLEGLPGHTSAGDVDPGILLTLANRKDWGPEMINECLAKRSGLLGLANRATSLPEALEAERDTDRAFAGDVFRYRLLLACGSCKAAMGGVDSLAFSGPYHQQSRTLGPWLSGKLSRRDRPCWVKPPWTCLEDSLHRVIADATSALQMQKCLS